MVNDAPDVYESYAGEPSPSPRHASRFRMGVRGGLVSAAATAGAVIGFGLRNGDWSGPFSSLGYEVLTSLGLRPSLTLLAAIGLFAHVAWMIFWGVIHAVLSARRTTGTAIVIAVVVSVSAAMLARALIPAAFGAVRFASLPGSQVVLCVALMTLGMLSSRTFSGD